ncbi:hypothetical protein B0A52_09889 [Exophiala mesophila]|uniref:Short-chain dehydrogenase n=1 Tax=Exophiala mesophila TaxID=212818 RepID=A0A438MRB0_EXOME|nr:hypothetical protein B0A52_09889 [Exophiala mesophila]
MTSTTHPEFDEKTEALQVAAAFPSLIKDRTVLITGVNKLGIGFTTAEAFASQGPRHLILAGRSDAKLQEALDALRDLYPTIDYRLLHLDLSDLKSVKEAAATVLSWTDVPTIDLLINNAGVMNIQQRTLSPQGIEMHLATNHIGPFLFTNLILPRLIAAAKGSPPGTVRVVNVSSVGAFISGLRVSDMNFTKPASELPDKEKPNLAMLKASGLPADESTSYFPMVAYGHSKACNVLFAVVLNQKLHDKYGILSLALHPGEIQSQLSRTTDQDWLTKVTTARAAQGFAWKTLPEGASTTMVAALDPKLQRPGSDGHGYFLNNCQIGSVAPHATDETDASKLWELSEDLVGEKFAW